MAERAGHVEPDTRPWAPSARDSDAALLVLRSRRRDPLAERVARELDRRRTPAELDRISERHAAIVKRIIEAVLDGIGLTDEQRARGIEILVVELRAAAEEEPE